MRKFKSGAVRSSNNGKIEYFGFRHPITELSFGWYMNQHRVQEDGNIRESNNWWAGWSEEVSIQSLIRHTEDLQAIEAGYCVFKYYKNGEETTHYITPEKKFEFIDNIYMDGCILKEVSKEDCYNAIRFGAMAGLLEHLKTR